MWLNLPFIIENYLWLAAPLFYSILDHGLAVSCHF
jgi:hypothetical protein